MRRHMQRSYGLGYVLATSLLAFGCSWSRFDDVSEDTPVVSLKQPGALQAGFGDGLATINNDESVQLFSTGNSPTSQGAVFELGTGERPTIDALDVGHCETEGPDTCASITKPVGLGLAQGPGDQYEFCFISGIGATDTGSGLMLRCLDDTQFELPVPAVVQEEIIQTMLRNDELPRNSVTLAADRMWAPAVAAGVPSLATAFYYAPLSRDPVTLDVPGGNADESYGSAVAVLANGGGAERVIAVSAPDAGQVWLFKTEEVGNDSRALPLGCLGGITGLGRALGGGRVDTDDFDDLVISDDRNVSVVSGRVLAELPQSDTSTCSFASLPEGGLLASFTCGSTKGVSGCGSSRFGASLAVGDLDGDGDGEVIVGAPNMTARGESNAGALIIYDAEGEEPHEFSEVLFSSSLEANDHLGQSLATPNLGDRHIIAAGAPGGGKTFLFYCSELFASSGEGSTRCR